MENLNGLHNPDRSNVFESKEAMLVDQVTKRIAKRIELGKIDLAGFSSDTEIETVLLDSGLIKDGVSSRDVIENLRSMGVIAVKESESKPEKSTQTSEFIPINLPKKELKIVHDEEAEKNFLAFQEEEKIREEKDGIFDDEVELDALYEDIKLLEKEKGMEGDDYYYEFAENGFIKGGEEEVRSDLEKLNKIENAFGGESQEKTKSKKIATMTEIGLEYGVTELGWYGDKVKVVRTSKFDDVRRGVDDVLEILRDNEGSSFMGLGIDVTYRGLHSEQYKNKVFNLLRSITEGYKTKVKYFKDHAGNMTKEFAVPKAILYFDFGEVKKMAYALKNISDEKVKNDFQNANMKYEVMNQIIVQCAIMARFARKYGNSITEAYDEVGASIQALSEENPEIKSMIAVQHEDKTSRHLSDLIAEFEEKYLSQDKNETKIAA